MYNEQLCAHGQAGYMQLLLLCEFLWLATSAKWQTDLKVHMKSKEDRKKDQAFRKKTSRLESKQLGKSQFNYERERRSSTNRLKVENGVLTKWVHRARARMGSREMDAMERACKGEMGSHDMNAQRARGGMGTRDKGAQGVCKHTVN
jgi:predicted secreted protein